MITGARARRAGLPVGRLALEADVVEVLDAGVQVVAGREDPAGVAGAKADLGVALAAGLEQLPVEVELDAVVRVDVGPQFEPAPERDLGLAGLAQTLAPARVAP